MTDLTNTAPKRIYLDIGDQFALERVASGDLRWDLLDGVTWSEDNATSHGIPYVRADLVPTPAASGAAPALPTDAMIHAAAHAFDVSNATFLVKMRCALSAALARQEAAPAKDGYATAFYEIASVLGIGARADTPENVFRNEMLPRIVALASREASSTPLTEAQRRISEFATAYAKRRGLDSEQVYSLGTADEPLVLRLSDLVALASPQVAPAPDLTASLEEVATWGCGDLHGLKCSGPWPQPAVIQEHAKAIRESLPLLRAALAAPVQVAPQDDARDAARLDFLIEHEAFVVASYTRLDPTHKFQCWNNNDDPDERHLSGEHEYFDTAREAIDAAIALSTPAAKPTEEQA